MVRVRLKFKRYITKELSDFLEEADRLRSDLIRFKNKYRKDKPLDIWVVYK